MRNVTYCRISLTGSIKTSLVDSIMDGPLRFILFIRQRNIAYSGLDSTGMPYHLAPLRHGHKPTVVFKLAPAFLTHLLFNILKIMTPMSLFEKPDLVFTLTYQRFDSSPLYLS